MENENKDGHARLQEGDAVTQKIYDDYFQYCQEAIKNAFADIGSR